MICTEQQRLLRNERVICLSHLKAVLVHEWHTSDLDAVKLKRCQDGVKNAETVMQDTMKLVVSLLDGSASGDKCNFERHR